MIVALVGCQIGKLATMVRIIWALLWNYGKLFSLIRLNGGIIERTRKRTQKEKIKEKQHNAAKTTSCSSHFFLVFLLFQTLNGHNIIHFLAKHPSFSDTSSIGCLPIPRTEGEILSSPNLKPFSFNELKNATRTFRPDSLLGEGGFGYVFKGWIDEHTLAASKPGSGMVVAVKKLKPEGFQGHKEWLTEVDYLGQLHHPNLVKLIGYCSEGENRLLVNEFMPKRSLENHLFRRGPQPLSWAVRLKVAISAARGLSFIHDLKS